MNGRTHSQYALAACQFLSRKGESIPAPSGREALELAEAAALPDKVDEVSCGGHVVLLGHNLSSFQHFQDNAGNGYAWDRDPSLSIAGELTAPLTALAGLVVAPNASGVRPPLSGLLEDSPMQEAAAWQPGVALGRFVFPPAAAGADFYARSAAGWLASGNATGWRWCAGYAIHFVADCCVPHHAAGSLLGGHAQWEDSLEAAWDETWEEVRGDLFRETLEPAIEQEIVMDVSRAATVGDLCKANAEWARSRYGSPLLLETCPGDMALRVSVRAIATSVVACQLMGCPF